MDAFIANNPELYAFWGVYMILVLIKTALCYMSMGTALELLHKHIPAVSLPVMVLLMLIAIPCILFLFVIPTLWIEKHKFFTVYERGQIIEDIEAGL